MRLSVDYEMSGELLPKDYRSGFMCPITIEGNPELIKLAYESGLGEKGSLGFGMLEIM